MNYAVFLSAVLLIGSSLAVADDSLRVVKLEVSPAAAPQPTLRYRFARPARELEDGNAAVLYYRAALLLRQARQTRQEVRDDVRKVSEWLEQPAESLPREQARTLLAHYADALGETGLAARRKQATWDLPLVDHGIATLLPEIQEARDVARLMALQARLAVLDGDFTAASEHLQAIYAMGRHVGSSGTLVSWLVGVAIQRMASDQVELWIAQPGSPSAYWALSTLPLAGFSVADALESEQLWIDGTLPFTNQLDAAILTEEQLEALAKEVGGLIDSPFVGGASEVELASGETLQLRVPNQTALLPTILRAYPAARRRLIEAGRSGADLDAMSPTQVVMISAIEIYRAMLDEMVLWSRHPYAETIGALDRFEDEQLADLAARPEAFLASLMLPAATAANGAGIRGRQQLALLRTVEALRLYAAAHEGRLPAKLADVGEVPVPLDPVVARPFDYKLDKDTATLVTSEKGHVIPDIQIEISVRK